MRERGGRPTASLVLRCARSALFHPVCRIGGAMVMMELIAVALGPVDLGSRVARIAPRGVIGFFGHRVGVTARIILSAGSLRHRGKGSSGSKNRGCAKNGQFPHECSWFLIAPPVRHNHPAAFQRLSRVHSGVKCGSGNSGSTGTRSRPRRSERSRAWNKIATSAPANLILVQSIAPPSSAARTSRHRPGP
jgi:hypothetical protein